MKNKTPAPKKTVFVGQLTASNSSSADTPKQAVSLPCPPWEVPDATPNSARVPIAGTPADRRRGPRIEDKWRKARAHV